MGFTKRQDVGSCAINQGLYRLRNRPVSVLSKGEGLAGETVYPILEDRSGAIWAGAWNGGVSRIVGDAIRNFTVAEGLPSGYATALAQDRNGRVWVAGYSRNGGLAMFDGDRFHPVTARVVPDDAVVTAIHFEPSGPVYLATSRGLVRTRTARRQSSPFGTGSQPRTSKSSSTTEVGDSGSVAPAGDPFPRSRARALD